MLYFDKIEVVNRLKKEYAFQTIKNYTIDYDKTWIFNKIQYLIFILIIYLNIIVMKSINFVLKIPCNKYTSLNLINWMNIYNKPFKMIVISMLQELKV